MCGQGFRSRGLAAGEFGLGVGEGLQRGVPLGLQAAGDQSVVRVDGAVAALGATGLVPRLLDLAAPLRQRGVVAIFQLLGGGQAGLQRRRLQRGQERLGDAASIPAPPTRRCRVPLPSISFPVPVQ